MTKTFRLFSILAFTAGLCAPPTWCLAAGPQMPSRMIAFAPVRDYSRGLDLTAIQPLESLRDTRSDDIGRIIPKDLRPNATGGEIATKIIDHSLSNIFSSQTFRNSELARSTRQLEHQMQAEASFGSDAPDEIRHVLKFEIKAAQTKAQLAYSGFTQAQLSYQVNDAKLDLEIDEKIASGTRVVFNHIAKPGNSTDMVSFRWSW